MAKKLTNAVDKITNTIRNFDTSNSTGPNVVDGLLPEVADSSSAGREYFKSMFVITRAWIITINKLSYTYSIYNTQYYII